MYQGVYACVCFIIFFLFFLYSRLYFLSYGSCVRIKPDDDNDDYTTKYVVCVFEQFSNSR